MCRQRTYSSKLTEHPLTCIPSLSVGEGRMPRLDLVVAKRVLSVHNSDRWILFLVALMASENLAKHAYFEWIVW
jgi:hypothetical protein